MSPKAWGWTAAIGSFVLLMFVFIFLQIHVVIAVLISAVFALFAGPAVSSYVRNYQDNLPPQ